jgi:subtilase family serine protease
MNPVFPGGSPWITSVGATYVKADDSASPTFSTPVCLQNQCATGTIEQGTTQSETGWTSGAGFTHWFDQPKYQQSAV